MADPETILGGAAGGGLIMAIRELINYFRKRDKDKDEKDVEDAQWTEINKLKEKHAEHEKEDATAFATVHAEQKHQSAILNEIKQDVKTVLRRSTGKADKS